MTAFKYSHSLVQTRDLTVDLAEFVFARLHPLADGLPNLSLEVTKGLLVVLLQILNSEHDVSVDPLVDGILELSPRAVHGLEITVDLAESVLSWLDPLSDGLAQLIFEVGNFPGVWLQHLRPSLPSPLPQTSVSRHRPSWFPAPEC